MRIVRFVAPDGREILGNDHGDGTATELIDGDGVLGPAQKNRAAREVLRGHVAVIADDDEGIRRAVQQILERFECRCTTCVNGAQAIDAIEQTDVDLVVSDIVMPEHNGYEVFRAAKKRRASMPVVLITGFGYDPGHAVVKACEEGVEAVLYKPFTAEQIIDKIAEAFCGGQNGSRPPLVEAEARTKIGSLMAPFTPGDVLCVGRNYEGAGAASSDELELFMKPRSALTGPRRQIRLPKSAGVDARVHAEGELAVVIGSRAKAVSVDDAMHHVLGYTVANDVTARHWQRADDPMTWMRGKGFDTFCPIGPAIVTRDVLDPTDDITITTSINGQVVRRGSTTQMLRSVPQLVSEVSQHITLSPGTLLLTGAPSVAAGETDRPLAPGDEVCVEIAGIGRLVNKVAG